MACDEAYPVIYYHYAAVIFSESRGEGYDGMVATLSALRNGARGYKVGRLDPDIVELVAKGMKKPISHPYRHWINFQKATDRKWAKWAKKQDGVTVGSHFFF